MAGGVKKAAAMLTRGFTGGVMAAVLALAGCSGGGAAATPAAPTPTYTKAQADACALASIYNFGTDAPAAEQLYFSTLGDVTIARKVAAAAAKKDAALVAGFSGTGADAEVAALHSALVAGASAFARPMTMDQFDAAYKAIYDANQAFSDKCDAINYWVQQNVPQ